MGMYKLLYFRVNDVLVYLWFCRCEYPHSILVSMPYARKGNIITIMVWVVDFSHRDCNG